MVLNNEILKNNSKVLADNHYRYMVLDVAHMVDSEMFDRFESSLQILNVRNAFEMINQLWRNMQVKKELDVTILNAVIDVIYNHEPFSQEQLKQFFTTMKEFEKALRAFRPFNAALDSVFINDEVEMLLLGISLNVQKANKEIIEKHEGISEKYSNAKYHYFEDKIDYRTFISTLEDLFKDLEQPGKDKAA